VGTSSPLSLLHASSAAPGIILEETDAGTDEKYWRIRAEGSILRFEGVNDAFSSTASWLNVTRSTGARTVDNIAFNTSTNERLRITSAGLVGIGTSAPATLLHLSSATGSASPTPTELRIATTTNAGDWSTTDPWGRISFYSADVSGNGPKIHAAIDSVSTDTFGSSSLLQFRTSLSDGTLPVRMSIDNVGRVGIGTTSPGRLLTVANAVNTDATIKDVAYFCGNYASNSGSGARILIGGDIPSVVNRGVALVGVNTGGAGKCSRYGF
jgi:hypothetical protein